MVGRSQRMMPIKRNGFRTGLQADPARGESRRSGMGTDLYTGMTPRRFWGIAIGQAAMAARARTRNRSLVGTRS
jgi:hypothetical protein